MRFGSLWLRASRLVLRFAAALASGETCDGRATAQLLEADGKRSVVSPLVSLLARPRLCVALEKAPSRRR